LVVSGNVSLAGGSEHLSLGRGEAAFFGADEELTLTGDGVAFLTAAGER